VLQGTESEWPRHLSTFRTNGSTPIAFSPDGLRLTSGSHGRHLTLRDGISGVSIATLEGHSSPIPAVVFSPDGSCLASGSQDQTL
jgi:WD40 repeat protein